MFSLRLLPLYTSVFKLIFDTDTFVSSPSSKYNGNRGTSLEDQDPHVM